MVAKPGFGNLLATLARWVVVWSLFASAGVVMVVAAPFASPRKLYPFLSWMFRRMVRAAGIRMTIVGRERLTPGAGYVYMIHHASVLDHFVLAASVPGYIVGLEKESNFRVPIYGWITRWWGNIPIVREDREKALAAIDVAKAKIRDGISVGIAPEGTRQAGGVLAPFKKGGFHMARDTGAPIVAVAMIGMIDRNPDKKFRLVGGPITVEFHSPIPSADGTLDELVERVRERLQASGFTVPQRPVSP